MRSCVAAIIAATLVVVVLAAAWFFREDLGRFAARVIPGFAGRGEPIEAGGPEMARRVEEEIVALGQGDRSEADLSEEELNAWITYGLRGFFPPYLSAVSAQLSEDDITLAGQVAVREVPGIERLGALATFLGDTAAVSASGRVDGLEPGRGIFYVDVVRLGELRVPDALRDQLLAALIGSGERDRPANAVVFQLPVFVADLAIRNRELVLRGTADGGR